MMPVNRLSDREAESAATVTVTPVGFQLSWPSGVDETLVDGTHAAADGRADAERGKARDHSSNQPTSDATYRIRIL
jgi:hypothetical protein